jgi:membrane protein insertase Oxa1/YidC/SpoIIIJ
VGRDLVIDMARTDTRWFQAIAITLVFVFALALPMALWVLKNDLELKDEIRADAIRAKRERRELEKMKQEVKALIAEKGSNDSKRDGNND